MIIERSDNIYDELFNFKVIHGLSSSHLKLSNNFNYIPNISKDVKVVMISNFKNNNENIDYYLNSNNLDFSFVELDSFKCWIDKIKPLLDLCEQIDNKYVLYLDTSDTILVSDLLNPDEILGRYNCKILFNAEDNYSHPGHPCDPKDWLKDYPNYYENIEIIRSKNKSNLFEKINTNGFSKSLNAGVFLGERIYLIQFLKEILELMLDNPTKGFPYGESDDQLIWQYLMSNCKNNEIEIDYYNLFFLWMHSSKFNFPPEHWEHFNYFNKIN